MRSLFILLTTATLTLAAEEPLLTDDFSRPELGEGWLVNTGSWKITDGVLHAAEIPSENHSAAARRTIVTQDATYTLRFRLTGDGIDLDDIVVTK